MATLKALLLDVGCADAETYIQSGNAVFTNAASSDALNKRIGDAISANMGRPIAVTMRTRDEWNAIVEKQPFPAHAVSPTSLFVTFLSQSPSASSLAPLMGKSWDPDAFVVSNTEIFALHPRGLSQSALAVALGKLRVEGTVTTRNWNTVCRLHAMVNS